MSWRMVFRQIQRHCCLRPVRHFSDHKSELLDAIAECRNLKFKAHRINCIPNHSFFESSAHEIIEYHADSDGHFQDTRHASNRSHASCELLNYSVRFDQLFKKAFRTVNRILNDQIHQVDIDCFLAIGSLLTYLNALEFHEECLQTLLDSPKRPENEIAIILAVHLFSKLSIDDTTPSYMISSDIPLKYKFCPCYNMDCKHEVLYGNTNIGSEHLFYGHPDIVVFPKGAGSCSIVVPRVYTKSKEHMTDVLNWDEDSDLQRIEVKSSKEILRTMKTQNQVASLAITFSFYQRLRQYRKKIQSPKYGIVSIIPTIAVSEDCFDIYMYDTENDIFLKNDGSPIPLWENENGTDLSIASILTLWMILNHLNFQPRVPNSMKVIEGSCGLREQLGASKLELIEKTLRMSRSKFMPIRSQNKLISRSKEIEFESDSDSE